MGYRLHSATRYDVKYGSYGVFNHASNYINLIIECLAEGDCCYNSEDYIGNADCIEANRNLLLQNVERIITPNNEWENQEELDELIQLMLDTCEISKEYLYKELKELITQSDANCEDVHFAWY